jgi:acetyltransferase-like isoleucine patch superfamily enzyme
MQPEHESMPNIVTPTRASGPGKRASRAAVDGYRLVCRIRDRAFCVLTRGAFASFGPRSIIKLPLRLQGEARIAVGDDVYVGAGSWLQVLGDPTGPVAISIGGGTGISGSCVLSAASSIRIGDAVLIARNVYIADHSHAYADVGVPVLAQGITSVAPVEIEDGAWLGQNVVVGPGVRIGTGAVVGANSVVLSDVPDYSVAVGAPARVVRTFAPDETPSR